MQNFDDIIGLPFLDGGRGPKNFDCWGIAKEVYNRFGIQISDYRISAMRPDKVAKQLKQEKDAGTWIEVHDPLPSPCLVVMSIDYKTWADHVGVYIGNGQFIHAYRKSGVAIAKIKDWKPYIVGFYVPS